MQGLKDAAVRDEIESEWSLRSPRSLPSSPFLAATFPPQIDTGTRHRSSFYVFFLYFQPQSLSSRIPLRYLIKLTSLSQAPWAALVLTHSVLAIDPITATFCGRGPIIAGDLQLLETSLDLFHRLQLFSARSPFLKMVLAAASASP
jgi:hypothetical protein